MRILLIILGIIAGAAIAWALNKFLSGNIENKNQRIGLQVATYIVLILLGFIFTSIFSLRGVLDTFMDNRIISIETSLAKMFPNSNILEKNIDTVGLVSINSQLHQAINDIDTKNDSFFEKLVFDAFIGRLSKYINAVDTGVNTLSYMSDDTGSVTIKAILYNLKNMALDTVSPYFTVLQIIILILTFVSVGIYFAIVLYIKKGSGLYNKSIIYGDINDKL